MKTYSQPDYLLIGHVARDLTPDGSTIGGTVTYAGLVANLLGCQTAVLTSAGPEFELDRVFSGMAVKKVPAAQTTTFENKYTPTGRQQTLFHRASPLEGRHVPEAWRRAAIVHLGPLAGEIEGSMIEMFSNSLVGLTPQGWLRSWDEDGRVFPVQWPAASAVLPLAAAVFLSTEDLPDDQTLDELRRWVRLLVLTRGDAGCTVFFREETRHFPAPKVIELESTGAGDIFAAAFLVRLHQTKGNPWDAAAFANRLAAQSVTAIGLDAKMEAIKTIINGAQAH